MVILNAEPWKEAEPDQSPTTSIELEGEKMFGFQDLASDYYQVLRQKERPAWCRIVWGIVIFILLCFTGFMVYQLLASYLEYQSYVESSMSWQNSVVLPAITICSTNPLSFKQIKKAGEGENSELFQEAIKAMQVLVETSTEKDAYLNIDMDAYENFKEFEHENGSLALVFKPHLYDMLFGKYDYLFRGIGELIKDSEWHKFSQMTELGVCFELNDDGSLKQTSGGIKDGLEFDLNANVDDYLFTTATRGFVIFIRDQDETIMLNRGGYIVSPGSETFIKLTTTSHSRLGSPYGTCRDVPSQFTKYGQHYESVRECVQRQRIEAMIEICECIPWYLADRLQSLHKSDILDDYAERLAEGRKRRRRSSDVNTSEDQDHDNGETGFSDGDDEEGDKDDHEEKENEIPEEEELENPNMNHLICGYVEMNVCDSKLQAAELNGTLVFEDCPEPCKYQEWNVEISSTQFPPSEAYFESFLKNQVHQHDTLTYEYIRENMARVHIYYDELKVNNKVQTKAYQIQSFIAELGGTVDLFIGFSFFTILQLIEISVAFCLTRLWQRGKRKDEADANGATEKNCAA